MKGQIEGTIVKVFAKERDRYEGRLLTQWIIDLARRHGVAVTVVHTAPMGYVLDDEISNRSIIDLSLNLPIVVELVGEEESMDTLLPELIEAVEQGIVVSQKLTMNLCTKERK